MAKNGQWDMDAMEQQFGPVGGDTGGQSQIVCPHCQVRGRVTRSSVKQKKGVSGAKATGAVLTAGFSVLATGLSRKETVTRMHCGNCGTDWTV